MDGKGNEFLSKKRNFSKKIRGLICFPFSRQLLGAYTRGVPMAEICGMNTKKPHFRAFLSPFESKLLDDLQTYWLHARSFLNQEICDYNSEQGQRLMNEEQAILKKLGLPSKSFKFADPIQRLGFENAFYPEIAQRCLQTLLRMAESYLMSTPKTPKALLQEALRDRTPYMELFAELNCWSTTYAVYLYYEHFLSGQIGVAQFWDYLQYLQSYRLPNGHEIPYNMEGLKNKRVLNALQNEDLWFVNEYIHFLRYDETPSPWEAEKKSVVMGLPCGEENSLIIQTFYITRVESKFAYNNLRVTGIVSIHGQYHQIDIWCSNAQFDALMQGSCYKQLSARIVDNLQLAKDRNDSATAIDVSDIMLRSLEINGCFLEIEKNVDENGRTTKSKLIRSFNLIDVELRLPSSFMLDE